MLNSILTYSGPKLENPPIVIPLKFGGSKWSDNELRYTLRSIDEYYSGFTGELFLLTTQKPEWLNSKINLIQCEKYHDAVIAACDISENYIWFNDDTILLKPTSLGDLSMARVVGKEMVPNSGYVGNIWRKKLSIVRDKLHRLGYHPIYNFSSHTPYVFNSKLMKHVILQFGIENKTPLETAYYNMARSWFPIVKCSDKITLNNKVKMPDDMSRYRFLNLFDKGLTKEVKNWLKCKFPNKSRFEK